MTNEQKLIDKCNRMAYLIGQLHVLLQELYNRHAEDENIRDRLKSLEAYIAKEFYGSEE